MEGMTNEEDKAFQLIQYETNDKVLFPDNRALLNIHMDRDVTSVTR